jgi:hypothetical protein
VARRLNAVESLLVGLLGVTNAYYVQKDVVLIARLAGWTDHAPPDHHLLGIIAFCGVVILWLVHRRVLLRR